MRKSKNAFTTTWLAVISPVEKVTNENEIVPAKATVKVASKAIDEQQSPAHDYNTCKLPEHNYAADDNPDDADTKESYEPELLEKYGKSMSAWKDDIPINHMSYTVKYFCDTNKYVPGLPKKVMNRLSSEIREHEKISITIHSIP